MSPQGVTHETWDDQPPWVSPQGEGGRWRVEAQRQSAKQPMSKDRLAGRRRPRPLDEWKVTKKRERRATANGLTMSAAPKALGAEANADRRCVIRWMMWTTIAIGRIKSHNL